MTGLIGYKLTNEQKEFVKEMQDGYHGDVDAFIADLKDKIQHQYAPTKKTGKINRQYSVQMISRIKADLPKIEELKRIADDLKQIDPSASLTDLL